MTYTVYLKDGTILQRIISFEEHKVFNEMYWLIYDDKTYCLVPKTEVSYVYCELTDEKYQFVE